MSQSLFSFDQVLLCYVNEGIFFIVWPSAKCLDFDTGIMLSRQLSSSYQMLKEETNNIRVKTAKSNCDNSDLVWFIMHI